MIIRKGLGAVVFMLFFIFLAVNGHAYIIDFEGLADLTPVTDQYIGFGLTFSNATAITAGISLNQIEIPPRSGSNVVYDNGGPIIINFSVPVSNAGGYFTYYTNITLTAYDSSNNLIATVPSSFSANYVGAGIGTPWEFLQVASAGGISRIEIAGHPSGGSFTLDDFTDTPPSTAVPEPTTILFLSLGSGLLAVARSRLMKKKS